jgi:hypothetical protein
MHKKYSLSLCAGTALALLLLIDASARLVPRLECYGAGVSPASSRCWKGRLNLENSVP